MTTYTTATAARALGLTPNSIARYCKRYSVGAHHGRDWLLTDADLQVIRGRMGKPGRKPRQRSA